MAKFCTKCGKALEDGERCDCQPATKDIVSKTKTFIQKSFRRMGVGEDTANTSDIFETDKSIVPDVVKANDSEVAIKQYEAATLRSRIRGQYAKGKLQVTNKRVLFRAPGVSYKGRITVQHEFDINEIAGVDVKFSNRISPLNIILSIVSAFIISPLFSGLFGRFAIQSEGAAIFLSIVFAIAFAVPFFLMKKKFWLKLLLLNCGMGCLMGTGALASLTPSTLLFSVKTNVADVIGFLYFILWLLNVILVGLVPDLTLSIKTKGAAEAFIIRRKQSATAFKQEIEYTGFSEVMPGKDINKITTELGALIDDIQTLGDLAIEQWKE